MDGAYNYWPNLRLAVIIEAMPIKKRVLLLQISNNLENMLYLENYLQFARKKFKL